MENMCKKNMFCQNALNKLAQIDISAASLAVVLITGKSEFFLYRYR
jgi:hypothetical protein